MDKLLPQKTKKLYHIPDIHLIELIKYLEEEYKDTLEDLSDCPAECVMNLQGQVKGIKKILSNIKDVKETKKDFK